MALESTGVRLSTGTTTAPYARQRARIAIIIVGEIRNTSWATRFDSASQAMLTEPLARGGAPRATPTCWMASVHSGVYPTPWHACGTPDAGAHLYMCVDQNGRTLLQQQSTNGQLRFGGELPAMLPHTQRCQTFCLRLIPMRTACRQGLCCQARCGCISRRLHSRGAGPASKTCARMLCRADGGNSTRGW